MPAPSSSPEPEHHSTSPFNPGAIDPSESSQRSDPPILPASLIPSSLHTPLDLPANFPDVEIPRFLYGDRLRWIAKTDNTDWGTVIGRFYSFAPHACCWQWCYLIWLDPNSPSVTWVRADIAWEEDLEAVVPASADCSTED